MPIETEIEITQAQYNQLIRHHPLAVNSRRSLSASRCVQNECAKLLSEQNCTRFKLDVHVRTLQQAAAAFSDLEALINQPQTMTVGELNVKLEAVQNKLIKILSKGDLALERTAKQVVQKRFHTFKGTFHQKNNTALVKPDFFLASETRLNRKKP